jgi:CRISPR-associated protein Csm4
VKVYEVTLKPLTGFATPLKGDTIFGQFCWQVAYDEKLFGTTLTEFLTTYHENPFVVFSSAFPKFCKGSSYQYALPTPAMPIDTLFELPVDTCSRVRKLKDLKAKRWMILPEGKRFSSFKELSFYDDRQLLDIARSTVSDEVLKRLRRSGSSSFAASCSQPHNSINRLTGTTGEGGFAPFSVDQQVFPPETELALFVGFDEKRLNIEQIKIGLERIGETGFGKDASTGLGRFQLGEDSKIDLANMGSDLPNACYTLATCVPEKDIYAQMFFFPFTRFGRHGDVLAKSGNPFKNPVIMADEGAVFAPRTPEVFRKPYIGTAIRGISKAELGTVTQGYALYLPVKVEV